MEQSVGILTFMARRFIAGETVEKAVAAVKELNGAGMSASLDILGENVASKEDAVRTADRYIELLHCIDANKLETHVSIKLTQMGLDISDDFCHDNIVRILGEAEKMGIFVRVDMEGTIYTDRTLKLVHRWHEKFQGIGTVIQAYLYRSEEDVKELNRRSIRVRLCKGAYKEPATVAFPTKEEVNAHYVKLADLLIKDGDYPAIASHDGAMISAAKESARKHGRKPDNFEFQMLYGVNRKGQRELVKEGYRMRVYTPFGSHWLPYFSRRIRERKENFFFVVKHLFKD